MKKFIVIFFLLIPFLAPAQGGEKKKAYYFYGEQCPHCKTVDAFFQANGIYDKYDITKLEVTANPFNGKMFLDFGKAFNEPDWGGVPAIVFGNKFLLGDKPIINNFAREIEAAENANELPDLDKISSAKSENNPGVSQDDQTDSAANGNKKNYFPVAIIALVAVGAGVLIYVNRKKT